MFDRFADVAVRLPVAGTFSYQVTDPDVRVGSRVRVPFRGREEEGIVCSLSDNADVEEVLPLGSPLEPYPIVSADQIDLAFWMADYYLAGPGECLFKMFPPARRYPALERAEAPSSREFRTGHRLNEIQKSIFDAISAVPAAQGATVPVHVVHGVTGSGKTEIYIHLMRAALGGGQGALMLVPEITLTVQLIERLQSVFGEELALLHSGLRAAERARAYVDLLAGRRRIAVGTRSAVFAPVTPGIIILDEEHDGSYKENSAPRYDARQVAYRRAEKQSCPLVFGSATPRLESAYRARNGLAGHHYHLIERRATGAGLAPVEIIQAPVGQAPISGPLLAALEATYKRAEQSILLLNRRGYYPIVIGEEDHLPETCPSCSVSLNLHRDQRLVCHYCGYARPFDGRTASGARARPLGSGTQKLEEYLLGLYPEMRIERLDTDVATRRDVVQDCISRFLAHEIDLLLGTQMIAKGLDAPRVTLVGVLQADHGLYMPDFRAGERTFALLTQVAGRSGRGEFAGRVLFECLNPDNPVLERAAAQDYEAFYRAELPARREAFYPPFCRILRVLVRGKDEGRVIDSIDRVFNALSRVLTAGQATLLGPAPAPIERLHDQYRHHVLLKTTRMGSVRRLLAPVIGDLRRALQTGVHLEVDFDPVDLF
ncbi:MAG: primosomal protein N' [Spirochaetales bacterium]|nr:primosomal protein N' [Leptospiraceae bacterium]MCP5480750.1 primosomal protein N' [Spirochaetales bacterium]